MSDDQCHYKIGYDIECMIILKMLVMLMLPTKVRDIMTQISKHIKKIEVSVPTARNISGGSKLRVA